MAEFDSTEINDLERILNFLMQAKYAVNVPFTLRRLEELRTKLQFIRGCRLAGVLMEPQRHPEAEVL